MLASDSATISVGPVCVSPTLLKTVFIIRHAIVSIGSVMVSSCLIACLFDASAGPPWGLSHVIFTVTAFGQLFWIVASGSLSPCIRTMLAGLPAVMGSEPGPKKFAGIAGRPNCVPGEVVQQSQPPGSTVVAKAQLAEIRISPATAAAKTTTGCLI